MIVNNLKVSIHGNNILNGISFSLNEREKIGLVGANGSGKSTLLKALSGELSIDSGTIKLNGQTIGYLKQEIPYSFNNYSILDYIKKEIGIDVLERRLNELESNLIEDNMEEYGNILNQFLAIDGYSFEENIKIILSGLKFNESLDDKIGILSGGEKIKVLLACLLLKNTDILLLDEPTNNLDIEAITWLENFLITSNKKMIIVSHDETFLNNIVSKIFELDDGKITEYSLKYEDYLIEKDNEYKKLLEQYTTAKEQRDRLKKQLIKAKQWSHRGLTKKAHSDNDKIANNFARERTNTSNVSKISKAIDEISVPVFHERKPISITFDMDTSKGNRDIILEDLICGYDVFKTKPISLSIPFGSRIKIEGRNGSGKTTLIKTILCEITPIDGQIIIGKDVKIGYISQDTLLRSEDNDTLLDYLIKGREDIDLSQIFILLDKFDISYEDKDKPYSSLSPGERTRVNLVKIALNKTNVLILDEVTNHLDKEALDLIYELIKTYLGTIISISHNRKYNDILNADIIFDMESGKTKYKSLTKK